MTSFLLFGGSETASKVRPYISAFSTATGCSHLHDSLNKEKMDSRFHGNDEILLHRNDGILFRGDEKAEG